MRFALLVCTGFITFSAPGYAQENIGVVSQPQTIAPNVTLERPQPGTCGAAPSVAQINRLAPIVGRMFPQPGAFNNALKAEIAKPCQRNRAAAYLIKVIAANNWAFSPRPVMGSSYPPGAIACGIAARSADLNALISKLRPLFADPRQFDVNIAGIARQPCIDARATLYLFSVMTDNDLAFRR